MTDGFYIDSQQVVRARSLDKYSWVEHGFGTRLSEAWPGRSTVTAKQIHSNHVLTVHAQTQGMMGEGDALIVSEPGTLIAISTADCLPILIVDPIHRVAAAIHAGWRGTVAAISTHAVIELTQTFGSRPDKLIAAIGPGIAECCFEVGPEVARQFVSIFPERFDLQQRTTISLAEANRRQLTGAGIPAEQISQSGECTCCGLDKYHSFRRDREISGRLVTAIGIRL